MTISQMQAAAPPGQEQLDTATYRRLQALTAQLAGERYDQAIAEHARFLAIRDRPLCMPETALSARLDGAVVLVTGGTGCIGSALIGQLAAYKPARIVSVSRGVTRSEWPWRAAAGYQRADVRNRAAMDVLIGHIKPDIIFHVAAQRDPGLAETEVHRTVTTNVLGTRNVMEAAASAGVPQVVCASTGKALRPYSPDMYTASKRAAEWVTSQMAGEMLVSAARFTHVGDNSIIYRRLREWAASKDRVIRLHSPGISFYVQSAAESAQLLLLACLGATPGEFRIHAISDLGWPVSLLDLALGVLADTGSAAPVYISGYDQGYEEVPFPGLYDPATAGDVSPLLNAFEAAAVVESPCPVVDAFRVDMASGHGTGKLLGILAEVCDRTEDPGAVRGALDDLSWGLLDASLTAAPGPVLARMAALTRQAPGLSAEYSEILRRIEGALHPVGA